MTTPGRLLVVDDDAFTRQFLLKVFRGKGFDVVAVESAEAALALVDLETFDAVLTDYNLSGMDGIEFCRRLVEQRPSTPVILMTAHASLDAAVSALRAGSIDFLRKPLSVEETHVRIARAIETRRLRGELQRLEEAIAGTVGQGALIGECAAMQRLRALIARVRASTASALVVGETGTGKEVVARLLHTSGPRASGPFVAVNCAAIPDNLFESELFGHVRGAFTDAKSDHTGLMLQASGGTLFLDELGDTPMIVQPKLLRALDERLIRPVGGTRTIPIDIRLVAATNSDLETMIAEGKFREDLYFRVGVVRIEVPPLRTRGNDILLLARHFLTHYAAAAGKPITHIHHEVARRLLAYPWPGNVRELRNAIEHAVAVRDTIEVGDLPTRIAAYQSSHVVVAGENPEEFPPLHEVERSYIQRVMNSVSGNKSLAAKILQVDRTTLYRRLERLKIE